MKVNRRNVFGVNLFNLLLLIAMLAAPVWLSAAAGASDKDAASTPAEASPAAANTHSASTMNMTSAPTTTRGMAHRHVKNWALQATGSSNPAVKPLDPNTIPKFVNQLTRPATFVSSGTKFDATINKDVP